MVYPRGVVKHEYLWDGEFTRFRDCPVVGFAER